jgi:RNA polymerase sigma factor (sigma-70 family)
MPTSPTRERLSELFDRFRTWRGPLRKVLLSRGSLPASDLDDVGQEVFLRLLRYQNADLIEHPQAYLFKMASNVAGEWAMRAQRRHPHDAQWLAELRATSQPDRELEQEAARADLHAALERLPARQREVLRLSFGEGLGRADIARQLKVSERVVKRDLLHAYQRLRTELTPELTETLLMAGGDS